MASRLVPCLLEGGRVPLLNVVYVNGLDGERCEDNELSTCHN